MTQPDIYLLGRAEAEELRLKRQIADLAPDSDGQFERIGIRAGEHVLDIGCGPGGVLHLLGKRVGPTGSVLGIDRSAHFVELARRFVADHALSQVEVREGDAYETGLPRASFDGAHMRLVLVNVPKPELIVREMLSLVRPGGWIASFEADFMGCVCDPPIAAWRRLLDAYIAYSRAQEIDLFVGRRTHRLFRKAGLDGIHVDAVAHVYPAGHDRRPILRDFINNVRDRLVEGGFIGRGELDQDLADLQRHLDDPDVLVVSNTFFRLTGRKRAA
jgi:SAM-dependent methyltransferase